MKRLIAAAAGVFGRCDHAGEVTTSREGGAHAPDLEKAIASYAAHHGVSEAEAREVIMKSANASGVSSDYTP